MNKLAKPIFVLAGLAIAGGTVVAWLRDHPSVSSPLPAAIVLSTQPTTRPTTAPVAITPNLASYIDVVRMANTAIPATQPLVIPVDLSDAAHIILHDAVYLDPLGHLWITRADARPTSEALKSPADPPEHLIRDVPVYVHWWVNDNGEWMAAVITRKAGGGLEMVTSHDRLPIGADRAYRWELAFSWDGKIVVPTDAGVSVFEVQPDVKEHFHALPGMTAGASTPLTVLDTKGVLAWSPWEQGRSGSVGVSRFIDGNWTDLTTDVWAAKLIQLIPLLDGSILQIVAGEADHATLTIAPLESADIDSHKVDDLVNQLSDPDDQKRAAAFAELSRYGPGLWPMLEKIVDDQPAEARIAIKQLLRSRVAPALGGMTPIEDRLAVVMRQNDGTALFYAPLGVRIPKGNDDPDVVSPAWISVRPGGRFDRPLPAALVADQRVDHCNLRVVRDDWILCGDAGVPRRFVGNAFVPLVQADERDFSQFIGEDRRGRWIFAKPASATTLPTQPVATDNLAGETLIIDPTILDPTPRLPVWTMVIQKGLVGWDAGDWPVIKRGGAWALKADSWEPLPEKTTMITDMPSISHDENTGPSTQPTTAESLGPPLRVTSDGTRYYDGRNSLIVIEKSGKQTRWPLPPTAVGTMNPPTLLRAGDGKLFLFNQGGRVLRIAPTPDGPEPFKLEATFTKDIPNTDHPTRIWLDPLGRINFECDANTLAVMFPSGHIPAEIAGMILDGN